MAEGRALQKYARAIDHVAIAVPDLDKAVAFYTNVLGFVAEEEKVTHGTTTAMRSRVVRAGDVKFVLVHGTSPESAVSQYIEAYGPGVQHVALLVDDIEAVVNDLRPQLEFDTVIITGPNLKQAFTHRDEPSGMVFELVERTNYDGFVDNNVKGLWDALESKKAF